MKKYYYIIILLVVTACQHKSQPTNPERTKVFKGIVEHGNFSDEIYFEVEKDSTGIMVFFSSIGLNASRIPLQNVQVMDDSINFELKSDFHTFTFRNKWIDNHTKLQGSLSVDTVTIRYNLERELANKNNSTKSEEVSFESNGLKINGTIWYPDIKINKGLVMVTSSGNWDRSSSRAETIHFAKKGYTVFHYDKRGTGNTEGDWHTATMEEILLDDINAIQYFSNQTGIPLSNIGLKGSSQGGTKIPYLLSEIPNLNYGVVISCPGSTLLESDLNYWRNRNKKVFGEDFEDASAFVRKYFEFVAGELTRSEMEIEMEAAKSKSWYALAEISDSDFKDQEIDKKLLHSPMPYFEKMKQPVLIVQGTMDEIIPLNSLEIIEETLNIAGSINYKMVMLENASHSMHYTGKSDFPYMPKLHPYYLKTVEDWMETVSDKK